MYESLAAVSESGSVSHRLRVRLAGAGAGAPAAGQPSNRDSARQSPSRSLWRSQVQMRLPSARGSLAGSVHHMRVVKPGRGKSLVRIRPLTVSVSRRPHSALAGRPLHGSLLPPTRFSPAARPPAHAKIWNNILIWTISSKLTWFSDVVGLERRW